MLPQAYRLRAARDFLVTTRSGVKRSRGCVVVFGHQRPGAVGPPRLGLAVGRVVGNSVQRHAVARRIRGALRDVVPGLPPGSTWVVRGLPGAAQSASLGGDVRAAVVAVQSVLAERGRPGAGT